jgi:hypothetical protein
MHRAQPSKASFMSELADQQLTDFVAVYKAAAPPPAAVLGAEVRRAGTLERDASRPKGPDLASIVDLKVRPNDIPVRLYLPITGPTGLALYLQSGGSVMGDLETHDGRAGGWPTHRTSPSSPGTTGGRPSTCGRPPSMMPSTRSAGSPPRPTTSLR